MCAKSGFNQKHKRPSHLIFHTKRAYFVCIQRTKNVPDGTFCSLPPPHLKSKSTRVINNTRQLISPHYLFSHPYRSSNSYLLPHHPHRRLDLARIVKFLPGIHSCDLKGLTPPRPPPLVLLSPAAPPKIKIYQSNKHYQTVDIISLPF